MAVPRTARLYSKQFRISFRESCNHALEEMYVLQLCLRRTLSNLDTSDAKETVSLQETHERTDRTMCFSPGPWSSCRPVYHADADDSNSTSEGGWLPWRVVDTAADVE